MESTLEENDDNTPETVDLNHGTGTVNGRAAQPGIKQGRREQTEPSDERRKRSKEKKHSIGLAEMTREATQCDIGSYKGAESGGKVNQAIGSGRGRTEQERGATNPDTFKRTILNRSTPQGTTLSHRSSDDQEPSDGYGETQH